MVYREALDADPEKFFLSSQVEQMLGHTVEEWTWVPDFWLDHLHPDDRERVLAVDAEANRTRRAYSLEYRFRRADDRYVWLQDEAVFLQPDPTQEGSWQGLLFDVTARKEAEEQLRASELVHSATVEHLPAIAYREPPTQLTQGHVHRPPGRTDLRHTADEWIAGVPDFWRAHPPRRRRGRLTANETANETKEPFAKDYRFRHRDGRYLWVHDEATFVPDVGGGWWQGFIIDITRRKEAEEQLREAEEKFRLIVEQGPAVIYQQEFDVDDPNISRTTYISPQQADMFGYTSEEVLADPTLWSRTVHPDDRERVLAADVESNRDGNGRFSLEYRMISKDGRIVWVEDTSLLVQLEGRTPFWQGFLIDITERKQAEEQLARALEVEREATRRLRALDEMKNTFLQAVSHDLRTPLAAILGLAITLERATSPGRGRREGPPRPVAKRPAARSSVTNFDPTGSRGIVTPNLFRRTSARSPSLLASRPDPRPALRTIPPVWCRGRAKLERIVENLLANLARHTPRPRRSGRIVATDEGRCSLWRTTAWGREGSRHDSSRSSRAERPSPLPGVGVDLRPCASSPSCTGAERGSGTGRQGAFPGSSPVPPARRRRRRRRPGLSGGG